MMKNVLIVLALSLSTATFASEIKGADDVKKDTIMIGGNVITQPEFKGGTRALYQYISDNFQYPDAAAKRSVSGKMEVEFTVEKSGDISFATILKGLDETIDDEILRLIKAMPTWIPATKNGEPVRYKVSMPLNVRASRKGGMKSSSALQDDYQNR